MCCLYLKTRCCQPIHRRAYFWGLLILQFGVQRAFASLGRAAFSVYRFLLSSGCSRLIKHCIFQAALCNPYIISNIECPIDGLMNEAAKSFYNYVLRPQETEGDRPQVVAERGGKFPRIENDANECLFFCQILLEPSHMDPVNK